MEFYRAEYTGQCPAAGYSFGKQRGGTYFILTYPAMSICSRSREKILGTVSRSTPWAERMGTVSRTWPSTETSISPTVWPCSTGAARSWARVTLVVI